ncbi:MAG: hypothetical protein EHM89_17225 [Acidobacteria bacterium]|nr:MAG: hypothetical protein EHM89_17225 [Acidobacteriota bacterium]
MTRFLTLLQRSFCTLCGHDRVLEFQSDRMLLRCSSCGHQTTGWKIGQRSALQRSNEHNHPVTRPVLFTPGTIGSTDGLLALNDR